MKTKIKRTILWGLTAAVAVALGIFELVGQPEWWAEAIAIIAVIATTILGKPWKAPSIDD